MQDADRKRYEQERERYEADRECLEREVIKLKHICTRMETGQDLAKKEIEELRKQVDALLTENTNLKLEISSVKNKSQQLEQAKLILEQELLKNSSADQSNSKTEKALHTEVETLSRKISDLGLENETLQGKLLKATEFKDKNSILQLQIDQLMETNRTLVKNNEEFQQECVLEAKTVAAKTKIEVADFKKEITELKKKLLQASQLHSESRTEHEEEVNLLKEDLARSKMTLSLSNKKGDEMIKRLQTVCRSYCFCIVGRQICRVGDKSSGWVINYYLGLCWAIYFDCVGRFILIVLGDLFWVYWAIVSYNLNLDTE